MTRIVHQSLNRGAVALGTVAIGLAVLAPWAGAQSTPTPVDTVPGPTTTAVAPTTAPTPTSTPTPTHHVAGTLWLDLDGDGVVDPGEPAFAGVTVILTDDHLQIVATRTTDANGRYDFGGLAAGTYVVAVKDGIPGGAVNTSDPDGNHDGATVLAVQAARTDQNFGFRGSAAICAKVKRDGRTLSDTPVLIDGPKGVTISRSTGRDGVACVEGLFPGEWRVRPTGAYDVAAERVTLTGSEHKNVSFAVRGATEQASSLAFTGGEVASLAGIGVVLVSAGALLVLRRSRGEAQPQSVTASR